MNRVNVRSAGETTLILIYYISSLKMFLVLLHLAQRIITFSTKNFLRLLKNNYWSCHNHRKNYEFQHLSYTHLILNFAIENNIIFYYMATLHGLLYSYSEVKSRLDQEDAERQFVMAHTKRLESKLTDLKVEEHLLKMVGSTCFYLYDIFQSGHFNIVLLFYQIQYLKFESFAYSKWNLICPNVSCVQSIIDKY